MSVSVTITNTTSAALPLSELYVVLDASGGVNDAITVERSVSELDSMNGLKALLDAGDVTVEPVQSSTNVDLLSVPLEQHGLEAGIDVNAVAKVVTAVVFADAFPTGVVPVVTVTLDKTSGPAARGAVWVENVTNAGFDLVYDVTTADAGLTNDANWKAVY